jgi:hypothetical protein
LFFREVKEVSAKEAVESAEKFVSCNASLSRSPARRIIALNSDVVGYEERALHLPFSCGVKCA